LVQRGVHGDGSVVVFPSSASSDKLTKSSVVLIGL
jgi:hypothetical protein